MMVPNLRVSFIYFDSQKNVQQHKIAWDDKNANSQSLFQLFYVAYS